MELKGKGSWARFTALLDVAENELMNYELEKSESREKERKLKTELSINTSTFLHKVGKENSDSERADQSFKLPTNYQKGERSERKIIGSSTDDRLKKLSHQPQNSDQQKNVSDGPGDIIYDSSKKSPEEMPPPKLKAEPIMAIPEAFYFEGHHQEKNDNNLLFSYGDIFKISSKRVRDEGETEMMKPRPKTKAKKSDDEAPTQPLPETFKDKIRALGGSESTITLVFQKVLTATDVSSHQNRLLMPFKQVKNHNFLTGEERDLLEKRYNHVCEEESKKNYEAVKIPALLIDPKCEEHQMNLTRWDMRKGVSNGNGNGDGDGDGKVSSNYSLLTQWSHVVKKNQLKEGDFVQLWGFRKGSDLGLALVLV